MCADIYRPAQRSYIYLQLTLQFVQNIKRVSTLSVEFVHKDYHRRFPHSTNLHKFPRLLLYTLSHIDHDDNAIYSRQRAISIFRKILVTWRIQDVNLIVAVIETHYRGSHRNAALFLYFHPVGCRCFLNLVRLNSTCHMDCATKQKQLLRQCCFTSIRVTDNRKCSPSVYFVF